MREAIVMVGMSAMMLLSCILTYYKASPQRPAAADIDAGVGEDGGWP